MTQESKRGGYGPPPTRVSLDELVAKGRTVIDRMRPIIRRTVERLRTRLQYK